MATGTSRSPNKIDEHVGARLRLRRKLRGMSQHELAQALGLTFQQVQKYERGTNRVSASKLYEAARALQVSVGYFFEGLASDDDTPLSLAAQALLGTDSGLELVARFQSIQSSLLRERLLDLVTALAKTEG